MTFQTDRITYQDAIKIGQDTAKVKIVEYSNLACPDALVYQETFAPFLAPLVKAGQVQRIIKHYNKDRPRLQKGSVVNDYLPYEQGEEVYRLFHQYIKKQDEWANLDLDQIETYLEEEGLVKQDNRAIVEAVLTEAEAVGVGAIPTIFVGDQAFVETVDPELFKQAILKEI